ncbi:hypothetical protein WR25_15090 [Diploscapter pachys]|uniref:Uncharacterized protein n=1 Tax=Diploscapter pachys TaxID=2018661 RepID=A0A2A2KCF0_9BILA|nr:hypothetical protein WR25_15090 [Diploscapter pachys]
MSRNPVFLIFLIVETEEIGISDWRKPTNGLPKCGKEIRVVDEQLMPPSTTSIFPMCCCNRNGNARQKKIVQNGKETLSIAELSSSPQQNDDGRLVVPRVIISSPSTGSHQIQIDMNDDEFETARQTLRDSKQEFLSMRELMHDVRLEEGLTTRSLPQDNPDPSPSTSSPIGNSIPHANGNSQHTGSRIQSMSSFQMAYYRLPVKNQNPRRLSHPVPVVPCSMHLETSHLVHKPPPIPSQPEFLICKLPLQRRRPL